MENKCLLLRNYIYLLMFDLRLLEYGSPDLSSSVGIFLGLWLLTTLFKVVHRVLGSSLHPSCNLHILESDVLRI